MNGYHTAIAALMTLQAGGGYKSATESQQVVEQYLIEVKEVRTYTIFE